MNPDAGMEDRILPPPNTEHQVLPRWHNRFPQWRNPYIDKLPTLPSYILAAETEDLSPADRQHLSSKCRNYRALVAELGSGSGAHLLACAQRWPDILFIGFELRFKRVFRTAEKAARLGLENVFVAKTSALKLPNIFSPGALQGIQVNFPDPWDKRRWEKHRLLSAECLLELISLLAPKGFFAYKTDHLKRFREVLAWVSGQPQLQVERSTEDLYRSVWISENIPTEFERLFVSQKMPIAYLLATKRI